MKTDKELLELAAKAAGVFLTPEQFAKECPSPWDEDWEPWYNTGCNSMIGMQTCYNYEGELSGWTQYEWNPLTDDGDALRLACDLGLRVYPIARTSTGAACSAVGSASSERLSEVCDQSIDVRTATRRAIVRAAAAIGETM